MEISVPVPALGLALLAQLRFFSDRHFIIVTDSLSQSHGTLVQVDAALCDADPLDAQMMMDDDDDDADADAGGQAAAASSLRRSSRGPPLSFEITPLLGGERDNAWLNLVARRVATVICEAMLAAGDDRSAQQRGGADGRPMLRQVVATPQRSFALSLVMMIHAPVQFAKSENTRHAMAAVKALESALRAQLMPKTESA